jgi:hypothetical protein
VTCAPNLTLQKSNVQKRPTFSNYCYAYVIHHSNDILLMSGCEPTFVQYLVNSFLYRFQGMLFLASLPLNPRVVSLCTNRDLLTLPWCCQHLLHLPADPVVRSHRNSTLFITLNLLGTILVITTRVSYCSSAGRAQPSASAVYPGIAWYFAK